MLSNMMNTLNLLQSLLRRIVLPLMVVPTLFAEEVSDQSLVSEWLKTERMIAQEQVDFAKQKQQSKSLLTVYKEELANLHEELAEAGKNAPLVDEEVEKLKQVIETTENARRVTIQKITQYQPQVIALYNTLPAPLQEQLKGDYFTVQDDVTNHNVGDSMRAILRILGDSAKFNRGFVFEDHEISLQGTTYRAKVFYLGLSKAFFLAGDRVGYGEASPEGWVFTEDQSLESEVKKAFAVKAKDISSAYFELPLQVR